MENGTHSSAYTSNLTPSRFETGSDAPLGSLEHFGLDLIIQDQENPITPVDVHLSSLVSELLFV